jgi:hypothetical protein
LFPYFPYPIVCREHCRSDTVQAYLRVQWARCHGTADGCVQVQTVTSIGSSDKLNEIGNCAVPLLSTPYLSHQLQN